MPPRKSNNILGTIGRIAVGLFAAVLGLTMVNNMHARDQASKTEAGQAWNSLSKELQQEACDLARTEGLGTAVDLVDPTELGVDRDEMVEVVEVMCKR